LLTALHTMSVHASAGLPYSTSTSRLSVNATVAACLLDCIHSFTEQECKTSEAEGQGAGGSGSGGGIICDVKDKAGTGIASQVAWIGNPSGSHTGVRDPIAPTSRLRHGSETSDSISPPTEKEGALFPSPRVPFLSTMPSCLICVRHEPMHTQARAHTHIYEYHLYT
jgi:hypothetical protein